ncbi:MAG: hypothetical protein RLZZ584_1974 [Pseudomonadota bacterium]|jgi:putative secretion ATPase (PEP-CTERM system associated)
MYEAHFGLSGPPFQLNPDPAFYFNSRGHGHALAYLRYGVAQGEGFIVVTGDIGAGKTTLVRTLLGELDRQQVVAAQIVSTQLESGELLQAIITAFGIPAHGVSKAYLIATLEAFLTTLAAQGRRALLIVDEAQNLNPGAVEELRMLSNFQLGNHSLLQSYLVGQPELRRILEAPDMEQLRQRVSASCHLGPLDPDETRSYVEHRLLRVGWQRRPDFSTGAFDELYRWSGGVPRRINRLANRVMLATFLENRQQIDAALVEATARELRDEIGETGEEPALVLARVAAPATQPPAAAPVAPPTTAVQPAPAAPSAPVTPDFDATVFDASLQPQGAAAEAAAPPRPPAGNASATRPPASIVSANDDQPTPAPVAAASASNDLSYADLGELDVPDALEPLDEIERIDNLAGSAPQTYLLALADDAATALKLAALGRALAELPEAPALLLVNPGVSRDVWPWDDMERLLPRPTLALHLGLPQAGFEQLMPLLFERFGQVLGEFAPTAVLVAGASDSLLAGALLAHKRGLPLARLDVGDSEAADALRINGQLIDQVAQRRYDCVAPGSLAARGSRQLGDARLGIQAIEGSLLADVCSAVEAGITTPTGACLRNNLSIYLGPDWSSEVQGTPYAVVALTLQPADVDLDPADAADPVAQAQAAANAERIERLLGCTSVPKLLWLADAGTETALRQWQAQASPALADKLFVVDASLSRDDAAYRRRLSGASLLSCQVTSLPDQFSLLRGALAVVSEPGHLLGEVARQWQLPCAMLQDDGRWLALGGTHDTTGSASTGTAPRGGRAGSTGEHKGPQRLADGSIALDYDPAAGTPGEPLSRGARAPELLDSWLGALAGAGYAVRAAQAAISAAATAAGARGATSSGASAGSGAAAFLMYPGAAAPLARALSNWLRIYAPADWAIEA